MDEKHPVKKYPILGACGLSCGLCPRHNTKGQSKCPGCAAQGFFEKHPSCGFITCAVKNKKLETCFECQDQKDCERFQKSLNAKKDSFISYQTLTNNKKIFEKQGLKAVLEDTKARMRILERLLDKYDDGRSKTFHCTATQILPLKALKEALKKGEKQITAADAKTRAKQMRQILENAAGARKIAIRT